MTENLDQVTDLDQVMAAEESHFEEFGVDSESSNLDVNPITLTEASETAEIPQLDTVQLTTATNTEAMKNQAEFGASIEPTSDENLNLKTETASPFDEPAQIQLTPV